MRLFGFEIGRQKAGPGTLSTVPSAGWFPLIREAWTGAWQRNHTLSGDSVLAHHAVFTCITLIADDIGKLRPMLVEQDADRIWTETESPAFSPVLRKPNPYQNRIQFIEWWITSKLTRGNAYALKVRDGRGVVMRLHLLDASRVQVLVAPDGSVFYSLQGDNLAGIEEGLTVPASEIIHDRMNCLFHPLVGLSPIFAAGLAANIGLKIQTNSDGFFSNGSNPGGVLTAPKNIPQPTADRIKAYWEKEFSGDNSGKIAVLGDGLTFAPMRMTAVDSQLIEQLKWTAETICSTFHVPAFKVGVGAMPTFQNGETLNGIYYSDCLQSLIEQFELCMDEGLGLGEASPKTDGKILGVELDLNGLFRMDTATQIEAMGKSVLSAIHTPNEARKRFDLKPKKGGDTPYLQQQNYGIEALAARDAAGPPPASPAPTLPAPTDRKALVDLLTKAIAA